MSKQPAYDSIDLDFQNKYRLNGLTQLSNNINVIPRNNIGDILLYEDSKKNPILIIEPIVQKFYNDSLVDIIDTQFKHYKFPVRTIIDEDDEEIEEIDFDELNSIETEDPSRCRCLIRPTECDSLPECVVAFQDLLMNEQEFQHIQAPSYPVHRMHLPLVSAKQD